MGSTRSEREEVVLRGLPISKGIGIGLPLFLAGGEDAVPEVPISPKEIEKEVERYRSALEKSRSDVEVLQKLSQQEGPPEIEAILGTQLLMMQDPILTTVVEEKIRQMQRNTESIFHLVVQEYKERFSTLEDSYFQERVRDIVDVSRRILGHLRPLKRMPLSSVPHNSILLSHELGPSETVEANAQLVTAFVTSAGGVTSHAAIIARAKGIPYVANIDIQELVRHPAESVIVDGSLGLVILNPSRKTLKRYQLLKKSHRETYKKLKSASHLKGETIDGYEIRLFANLENPKEVDPILKEGAAGVGLFRSEYLFLAKKTVPSEEEQFQIYRKMARALQGKPLVIRVFDVGGDKKADPPPGAPYHQAFQALSKEVNPALGCRAIRFLLRHPSLLRSQLRAILRASAFGEIHILIPMVADVSELRQVKAMIGELQAELKKKQIRFSRTIPVGCMIEVPSSAIMCDALAQEADFLSIGTNDLGQYVLAADRSNPQTADLYFAVHPSILRLIRMVVASANRFRKQVILCGEIAADPQIIPLLLGLGIREFSVAGRHIPLVKHTIRKWRILEACRLAEGALEHTAAADLQDYLSAECAR